MRTIVFAGNHTFSAGAVELILLIHSEVFQDASGLVKCKEGQ
jgi:hypothetical protein